MSRIVWYRYKCKWSYGHDDEYTYKYVHTSEPLNKDTLPYIKMHLDGENEWSEHYRGVDVHIVYKLPKKVKECYSEQFKSAIQAYKELQKDLEKR